jgi:hypothetical protein
MTNRTHFASLTTVSRADLSQQASEIHILQLAESFSKGTGWVIRGSIPCKGKSFFSSPKRPDRFHSTPSSLFSCNSGERGEAWCWPLTYSVKAQNEWDYASTNHTCLHGAARGSVAILPSEDLTAWTTYLLRDLICLRVVKNFPSVRRLRCHCHAQQLAVRFCPVPDQ